MSPCECDAQGDQGCEHGPDPCFSPAETSVDVDGTSAPSCLGCATAHRGDRWAYWPIGGGYSSACPACIPACLDEPENGPPAFFSDPAPDDSCESCGEVA